MNHIVKSFSIHRLADDSVENVSQAMSAWIDESIDNLKVGHHDILCKSICFYCMLGLLQNSAQAT